MSAQGHLIHTASLQHLYHLQPPWWMQGGHAQTTGSSIMSHSAEGLPRFDPPYQRQRWTTPDGDFIDVDYLEPIEQTPQSPQRPLLILFHGLEGSSLSHYARAFAWRCQQLSWGFVVPHFRGCSGELNRAPRAYHSGDFEEVAWLLQQFKQRHPDRLRMAAGVSLGGNALLRWAQETGKADDQTVQAICSICAPMNLAACANAISLGFGLHVYTRVFLNTLVPKARALLKQHPDLFDAKALDKVRTMIEFDDLITAPLHGFANAADYYARAASADRLAEIQLPALIINPHNDPFVPIDALPKNLNNACVQLCQPQQGGHVGFAQRSAFAFAGHLQALPVAVCGWFNNFLKA